MTSQVLPYNPSVQTEERADYITQLQEHILPEYVSTGGELNWGRLICTWHQKRGDEIVTHTYAACVDAYEGSIYVDCRPLKIFAKCVAHLFARPLHALIKTVYSLSLYPIFRQIVKFNQSPLAKEEKIKNLFKAAADIVMTPVYGVILTVATVAVLIMGLFSPENLYEGRKLLGKIELASNWGDGHSAWTLTECFQPYPLEILGQYGYLEFEKDTVYPDGSPLEKQLANFARAHIRHKHKAFDYFECRKLKKDDVYHSPVLEYS